MSRLKLYHRASEYLECEKWWVFTILMGVSGFFGAFTYTIRGGVFCNAQTANFVLLALDLGNRNWSHALYLVLPITAYFLGAVFSEWAGSSIKRVHLIRWDTMFIILEMAAVLFLGFLPESAPFQISQIVINFLASMQYNTFRQAQGIPMATTFCTNHLRQTGVACCKAVRHHSREYVERMLCHVGMLAVFVLGGVIGTVLCNLLLGRAIWFTLIPLAVVLADLLYADLKKEKGDLSRIPRGH